MFENYTAKARRVIFFARFEVSELGAAAIGTEHLMLGLLRESESLLSGFLSPHASVDSIRQQVENNTVVYEKLPTSVEVPLSDECKNVLAYAEEEAKRLAHHRVAPEHLLLGLLRESHSLAARTLNENGVQLETVRGRLGDGAGEYRIRVTEGADRQEGEKMRLGLIAEHFAAHRSVVERSAELLRGPAEQVALALVECLRAGKKVIAFGNGGSAAQASHLVGELLGRFRMTRQPFPAIALASDAGTVTCIGNDFGYDVLFERQAQALAQPGDVAFGFTTSGRSENVRRGLAAAKERGAITVAVTGSAGLVGGTADHIIAVPSDAAAHVQEVHLMLLHVWCIVIDEELGNAVQG